MKKILLFISLIPFFGCGDFLEEVDQDKIVPEKTDHFAALLLQEFNHTYPHFAAIDHMTDDVVENATSSSATKMGYKTTYTWKREIEINEEGDEIGVNNAWEDMYEDIAIANYVIELIDEALGEQSEIDFVKGEAYFIRALSYFNLLNLYGQPYDAATANADLGVVLRDDIGVEVYYNRSSVSDSYALIEADIIRAIELIAGSELEKSLWHPNVAACNLLMSRVKLYQENWDEAIAYATKVTDVVPSLPMMKEGSPYISADNSELLYSYFLNGNRFIADLDQNQYRPSPELLALYDAEDVRMDVFFDAVDDGAGGIEYAVQKYLQGTYTEYGYTNMRASEAYLNRAEAYAHKGDVANATADIQTLHAARYSDASGVVYPTTTDEMLAFVLDERRKELCFEDHHRWFDLRRMENRPEIKHTFTLVEGGVKLGTETYTLLSDDLNYTLPLPLKERRNNPLIRNNERYEKIPVIDEEFIFEN